MTRKNAYLDVSESEDAADLSSDDDLTKGGGIRPAKRRKIEIRQSEDASEPEGGDATEPEGGNATEPERNTEHGNEPEEHTDESAIEHGKSREGKDGLKKGSSFPTDTELPDMTKPRRKNLIVTEKAMKKSGVIFISRVPPFMKPAKMRSLLEPYGTINRMFLAPEDPTSRTRRLRGGGNKKALYTEGWVEFVRKKEAKAACELLNAQIIGGKKRSYYHDDIWNLVYLKGFKWHHLTQQIAAENAERTSRIRAEIRKSTRENKEFVRNVERAKMLDGMQAKAKKKKKRKGADDDDDDGGNDDIDDVNVPSEPVRTFKQVPQVRKPVDSEEQPENVTRVLSKIF